MKIKFHTDRILTSGMTVKAGKVVTVSDLIGNAFVNNGVAVEVKETKKEKGNG